MLEFLGRVTGIEPATSRSTIWRAPNSIVIYAEGAHFPQSEPKLRRLVAIPQNISELCPYLRSRNAFLFLAQLGLIFSKTEGGVSIESRSVTLSVTQTARAPA